MVRTEVQESGELPAAPLNRWLGWSLLVAGFVCAAWLDPWSLAERDPAALAGTPVPHVRHAQAVILAMAFAQLLVARLSASPALATRKGRAAALLTACGAAPGF
jgi:hypothetical protein